MSRHNDRSINANGTLALWEAGCEFNLQSVKEALDSVGAGKFCPNDRTKLAALKVGLTSLFSTRGKVGHAVVPVRAKGGEGYNVIEQVVNEATREVEKPRNIAKVWLERDGQTGSLNLRVEDCLDASRTPDLYAKVNAKMREAEGNVDGADVSETLVRVLREWCGISLRTKGGIYWLPADAVESWHKLGAAIEKATVRHGAASCFSVTTVGDSHTVRTITSSFVREADAMVAEVEAELNNGEVATGAAASKRARDMAELVAMAERYEEILGASLADLKTRIEDMQIRASTLISIAA